MSTSKRFATVVLGAALAGVPAFAQEGGRSEVSVQAFGSFVKNTTQDGVSQGATNSGGVLANYRFFFSNSHGVEVNYGYSLNTQTYGLATGLLGVKSNQHEVSAAYVYRHALRHFTPFAEAGVGGAAPRLLVDITVGGVEGGVSDVGGAVVGGTRVAAVRGTRVSVAAVIRHRVVGPVRPALAW